MLVATSTLRSTPRLAAFAVRRAASTSANAAATANQAKDKAAEAAEQAKEKASDAADKAKQQASNAAETAKGYMDKASTSGSKILGQIEERAGGLLGCKLHTGTVLLLVDDQECSADAGVYMHASQPTANPSHTTSPSSAK